jgi:hypothetical protein
MVEGLRRTAPNAPPKIKLNSVLNAVTRRGPFLGNSAGVVAMVYNGACIPAADDAWSVADFDNRHKFVHWICAWQA